MSESESVLGPGRPTVDDGVAGVLTGRRPVWRTIALGFLALVIVVLAITIVLVVT
jgi:hypothetical protein